MDEDACVERAAAEAAAGVDAFDVSRWAGLLLYPYGEELVAVVWGMPDLEAPLGISSDTMDELGMLECDGEVGEFLRERVQSDDSWELVERFYLALARYAHARIGRPVLVYESMAMSMEEQLARQGGRGDPVPDPLAGLDVILSVRVDEHRVAALWRDDEGYVVASGSVGHEEYPESVGRCTSLGTSPVVLAGELPPGAVAPVLTDGEPIVGSGYWLCLTRRRTYPEDAVLRFLDAEGEAFAEAVPVEGLPWLWPRQAPARARVAQHGSGTQVLEAEGWRIQITDWGPFAPAAGEVAHELGVEEDSVSVRPIAGSVLGHRHGFELAARDRVWAAVADCGAFAVTVKGRNKAPARLDLELFDGATPAA